MNTHPARTILEEWGARYPGVWRIVDEIRQARPRDIPPYVFLPLGAAAEAMDRWRAMNGVPTPPKSVRWEPVSELKQFASWRPTQGIYRFDDTLYQAIITTPLEGNIPAEMLQRLPEWCVYIETPGLSAPLAHGGFVPMLGVWVTIEYADNDGFDVLHLGLHTERGTGISHLPLSGTLDNSLKLLEADWEASVNRNAAFSGPPPAYVENARKTFTPILSLALYLCAEASEIGDGSRQPIRPEAKRTRHGPRLFPADRPTVWGVGVRMGAALRRAYQAENDSESLATGRHVRPHVRRAHWHTFLAGPKREEKRVKWLPPIPVNLNDLSALPATIRPVEP